MGGGGLLYGRREVICVQPSVCMPSNGYAIQRLTCHPTDMSSTVSNWVATQCTDPPRIAGPATKLQGRCKGGRTYHARGETGARTNQVGSGCERIYAVLYSPKYSPNKRVFGGSGREYIVPQVYSPVYLYSHTLRYPLQILPAVAPPPLAPLQASTEAAGRGTACSKAETLAGTRYTPLMHSSHALLSCTPLMHSSHALLSCTPLMHSSHTHRTRLVKREGKMPGPGTRCV
jgi:hypothetical protein